MTGCTWARDKAPSPARALTLTVTEPAGVARTTWPLSAGVPLPRGMVRDASMLRLLDGSTAIPVQARVLSRWPDGSARWALLDWQADLAAHQERHFRVEQGKPTAPVRAVKVADLADRLSVDTGPLQFAVLKRQFGVLSDVRLNGQAVTSGPLGSFFTVGDKRLEARAPATVTVTEVGPLRVRIELRGSYAARFEYVIRIDAFAGQPFVRVLHTFMLKDPEPYTQVQQIALELPLALQESATYRAGLEKGAPLTGAVAPAGVVVFQESNESLRVGGAPRAEHAAGWVDVADSTHGVALAARYFWQEYPQSFQLRPNDLTYNLWAPDATPAKVGTGAAKTHELTLLFHAAAAPSPTLLGGLAEPVPAHVDPQWVAASGALRNSIAPSSTTSTFLRELGAAYGRYQTHAAEERWDDSGQVHCPDPAHERPRHGFYGMFNWGDWNFPGFHDTTKGCDAWGNLEYDMTHVLALAYAATGEPRFFDGMVAAARHFMDVDRIYFSPARPNWVGMNHPKNPLHFTFELGGVDLGHTWTEGLLSYYYLTGDTRGLEAARGIADYLAHRVHAGVLIGNPRQYGWPQIALVAAYEATGEDSYRSAALAYARAGMKAHAADAVAQWKVGILAEALAYTHSITQEAAIREWLTRYADAVRAQKGPVDPRFLPAVAYVGRLTGKAEHQRAADAAAAQLKFGHWGKPFTIAGRLGFSLLSQAPVAAAKR